MLLKKLLCLGAAMSFSLAATIASAQTITLTYSPWLPVTSWVNKDVLIPYFSEFEKVTEGRVKVNVLPKVVGSAQSQFDVVRDGLADLGYIVVGYTPGRFKLAEVGGLPFMGDKAGIMGPAFFRMYEKYFAPLKEFPGVHTLSVFPVSPGHVFTTKRAIETIEDFKGVKLRSVSDPTTRALELLGAIPILKSSTEAFEMLTTGAIDGTLAIPESIPVQKLEDMLNHGLLIPGGLFNSTLLLAINEQKWAQISPKDREAIMKISGAAFAAKIGAAYDQVSDAAIADMKARGKQVITADAQLSADLKAKLAPIEKAWIDVAIGKGLSDPAKALQEFRAESKTQ